MSLRFVPFKAAHLEVMEMRGHELALLEQEGLGEIEGLAITGVSDGRIISCGGIILQPFGNAYIWQIPSIYVKTITMEYAKFIRHWLMEQADELKLNRMETLCLDDDLHNRWMNFLGFEKEGVKKRWCHGKDYVLWARLWGE